MFIWIIHVLWNVQTTHTHTFPHFTCQCIPHKHSLNFSFHISYLKHRDLTAVPVLRTPYYINIILQFYEMLKTETKNPWIYSHTITSSTVVTFICVLPFKSHTIDGWLAMLAMLATGNLTTPKQHKKIEI